MKKTLLILLLAVIYAAPAIASDDASSSSGSSSSSSAAATITQTDEEASAHFSDQQLIDLVFQQGENFFLNEQYQDALNCFTEICDMHHPSATLAKRAEADLFCGRIHMTLDNSDEALRYFTKITDHWGEEPSGIILAKAYFYCASIYRGLGRNQDAMHWYQRVIGNHDAPEDMRRVAQSYIYQDNEIRARRAARNRSHLEAISFGLKSLAASAIVGLTAGALTTYALEKSRRYAHSGKLGILAGLVTAFASHYALLRSH